jgi:RNA polymerase sigma-70 factor (ECF subfamily)
VTYASTAINFVTRTNPAVSKSLPAFRTRKKTLRSTHCEPPLYQSRHVSATQQSDAVAKNTFKEMFVASRPKFVAVAQRIVRNGEDAEDAVQNAFISGFRHLHGFDGRCALTTWFTRIVMNSALMILRKRRLGENAHCQEVAWIENIPSSQPYPETVYTARQTLEIIEGILEKMKPLLRQAFTMTYFDELSSSEACALLRVPLGTFKARLRRARLQVYDQTERALTAPLRRKNLSASAVLNGRERQNCERDFALRAAALA